MLSVDDRANHKEYGNILFGDGHVAGFAGTGWYKANNYHGIFNRQEIWNTFFGFAYP